MVMITADSSTNTSETMSYDNGSSLREDSFSSYSNEAEDTFVLQLEESSKHFNSFPSISHELIHLAQKKTEYGEIGIYGADIYFNEEINKGIPKTFNNSEERCQNKKDDSLKIRSGTPSVRSELSLNSQSSLLKIPRNQNPRKATPTRTRKFLSHLGFKCSCNDKKSVDVDTNARVRKAKQSPENGNLRHFKKSHSNISLQEDKRCDEAGRVILTPNNISLPVFNSKTGISDKVHLQEVKRKKSSEVFGSPIATQRAKSFSLERGIARLSWDSIPPRDVEIEIPGSFDGKYNDTNSDASSDLFEIESLSTICYAPGESSMEWSSVTANAAHFSANPDTREVKATITQTSTHINVLDAKRLTGKEIPEDEYRTSNKVFPSLQH